jgi:ATP synthase protein I
LKNMAVPLDQPDAQRPCFAAQRPDAADRPPYLAAKRIAFGVVRGQAAVTLAAALVGWALGGLHVGVSAALGGAIGTLASLGMALIAFRGKSAPSAARILGTFYAGEIVKVALAIVSFILVLKLADAAPLPMFAAYMATFVVYWIVLARMALPSLSSTHRAARGAGA